MYRHRCHVIRSLTALRLLGVLVVVVDAFHGCWSSFGSGCGHHVSLASLLGGRGRLLGSFRRSSAGGVV